MSVDPELLSHKLIHLLPDPVFVVDENGCIVFVSKACETLLGYTAEEMLGTPITGYVHPDDQARTLAAARRVMDGQPHIDFENRYVRKDGDAVHILWSARWYEEDRVRIAVARDVTALRRADQKRDILYQVSQAAHAADNARDLCEAVCRILDTFQDGDDLYVALYDADRKVLSYPRLTDGDVGCWVDAPLTGNSAAANVIRSGQALLATRDGQRPGLGLNRIARPGESAWLGVPVVSRDRVLGLVIIENRSPAASYSTDDLDLLQFVAMQMATALERKQAEDNLRYLAHHDPLTGLTNRTLFYDRLETALRTARRTREKVALLYLDLNGFKQINDRKGHEAGDRVLCEVAARLEACTRESDTVARMGGDEFTVLLTGLHDAGAVEAQVRKIRDAMAAPMRLGDELLTVSTSIGAAIYPDDGEDAGQLLRHADASMYVVKRASVG
ncbi:GGDEF domain-containing protein [Marinobacter halodurans]|uniref:GGDEF domain-containing protein n=1 Tax=Marinobacter halodurans TaxID=2528979 RepID=A0ABY1ZGR9_9GAMM|nr:GGDEF domain-containing protein [Marinobacter halodurans]TBW48218.1 GGDEF domain-containing protein [Marinobacter halodurans]